MIATDLQPISIVEDAGFISIICFCETTFIIKLSGVVLIQYSIPSILKRKLLGIGIGMKFLVSPTTSSSRQYAEFYVVIL